MSSQSDCLLESYRSIIGATTLDDLELAEAAFGQLEEKLPSASTPQEPLLLRALLLEFASRGGTALHARLHALPHLGGCKFRERELLVQFLGRASDDPAEAFRKWAHVFCGELCRHRLSSAARQAARLLRQTFRSPLNIEALALRLHTTPSQLRRGFQQAFGMPPREYIRVVRLLAALARVMKVKAEALALEIGNVRE